MGVGCDVMGAGHDVRGVWGLGAICRGESKGTWLRVCLTSVALVGMVCT